MRNQKKSKQGSTLNFLTKKPQKQKQNSDVKTQQNHLSYRSSYQQNIGSQQSIIHQHLNYFDEVPPLIDLSLESIQQDEEQFGNTKNKKHYVDSIYIEQDQETDVNEKKNGNNISLQDTQIPETLRSMQQNISRIKISKQPENSPNPYQQSAQKQKQSNRKLQKMALQVYSETLSKSRTFGAAAKNSKQLALILLTSSQKCTNYRKQLNQQRILASRRHHEETLIKIEEDEGIDIGNWKSENRAQKDVMVLGMLECLLSKIWEKSEQGVVQGVIDGKGELFLNFSSSLAKQLQKYSKDKQDPKAVESLLNERKRKIQMDLEQQDKMLRMIKESYQDIINDYATSIHNLMEQKKAKQMKEMQKFDEKSSSKDEDFKRIMQDSENNEQTELNRFSQRSNFKKRITFTNLLSED